MVEGDVKHQFEQARWLADSMLEAAEIQLREENKKADKQYESQAEALDAMESQVRQLMETYGYSAPPVPTDDEAPATPATEADPAGGYEQHRQAAERHLAALRSLWLPRMLGML